MQVDSKYLFKWLMRLIQSRGNRETNNFSGFGKFYRVILRVNCFAHLSLLFDILFDATSCSALIFPVLEVFVYNSLTQPPLQSKRFKCANFETLVGNFEVENET